MRIIGHRGARGLAPENTIAALQKGLEHQADELEFDLRITKDTVVIVHHDAAVQDGSGHKLAINQHSFAELKAHKPDLATFTDVLDIIGNKVPLYVEVKSGEPVEPIIAIIKKYLGSGWQAKQFLLGSKSQKTLLALQAALPDIEKIVIEGWSGVRATARARQLGTKRLSMNQHWLWWGFIRSIDRGGYELAAYTLNNPAKAKRWAKHGLSAVVTDYPDRFQPK